MDPQLIHEPQWQQILNSLSLLVLFAALTINGALAWLLAHAIIPSLVPRGNAPAAMRLFRPFFYLVSVLSFAGMVLSFGRGVHLAIEFIEYYYPRFLI